MKLCEIIGSILSFKKEPITISDLKIIKEYLEKENINLITFDDIPSLVYMLKDYNNYFSLLFNKIEISQRYKDNTVVLKRIFFDKLEQKDKLVIYNIINKI